MNLWEVQFGLGFGLEDLFGKCVVWVWCVCVFKNIFLGRFFGRVCVDIKLGRCGCRVWVKLENFFLVVEGILCCVFDVGFCFLVVNFYFVLGVLEFGRSFREGFVWGLRGLKEFFCSQGLVVFYFVRYVCLYFLWL